MEEMLQKIISQAVETAIAPLVQEVRELRQQLDEVNHLDAQKIMTVAEAADMLGITRQAVQKAMRDNRLKYRTIPGHRGRVTTLCWIQEMLATA